MGSDPDRREVFLEVGYEILQSRVGDRKRGGGDYYSSGARSGRNAGL